MSALNTITNNPKNLQIETINSNFFEKDNNLDIKKKEVNQTLCTKNGYTIVSYKNSESLWVYNKPDDLEFNTDIDIHTGIQLEIDINLVKNKLNNNFKDVLYTSCNKNRKNFMKFILYIDKIIGINNRDYNSLETHIKTTTTV